MNFEQVWERVQALTKWTKYKELADFLGITAGSVNGAKNRGKFPAEWALKISHKFSGDLKWLLTGESTIIKDSCSPVTATLDEFVFVPQYDAIVEAGHGAFNDSEEVVARLAFRKDWIKEMGLDSAKIALVRVSGDSMQPTLINGDMLMLDMRLTKVRDNAIYVIESAGQLRVKRIQPQLDGSVLVLSDNKAYNAEMVQASEAERLRVIGRAVWAGKVL